MVGKIKTVKLIVGLLSADQSLLSKSKKVLEKYYGLIDLESSVVPFNFTHYYDEELGTGILRQYISFKKLIKPENIGKIKRHTIKLEEKFTVNGNRGVNIDPGFISLDKLALATTKDATYRIYLGKGIYVESTLFFKDGSFNPWPWSYPDYKSETGIAFFNKVRELYRNTPK